MSAARLFICACLGVATFMWFSKSLDDFTIASDSSYEIGESSTFTNIGNLTKNQSIEEGLNEENSTEKVHTKVSVFDTCILPDFDPWDKDIIPFVNLDYDPLKFCNRSYKLMTSLKNGIVTVNAKDVTCFGR
ncbi:unnamed protein product [Strongylus vulgaris]|uniref:Uncharacterized protein n=1 Tax=Strongylus vulgaris TaxID=40348 RepID=A0A3P7IJR9_STRVU|nr:unnamed protein product [Strongylus vulgaris]